jgi:hypothetical protein
MSILVIAEHDNNDNKSATLVTIAAAQAIGGDIDVLVAGSGVDGVASQVAAVPGVNKVLVADNALMSINWRKTSVTWLPKSLGPTAMSWRHIRPTVEASCHAWRPSWALLRFLTLSR